MRLKENSFEEIIPLCTKEIELTADGQYYQLALLLRGTMYYLKGQLEEALSDLNELLAKEELDKNVSLAVHSCKVILVF